MSRLDALVQASLLRRVPTALMGQAPSAAMLNLASKLPGVPFGLWGYEVKLGETPSLTDPDMLFCLEPGSDHPRSFAQAITCSPPSASPVWPLLAAFCSEWIQPTATLSAQVRNLWIEFDSAEQAIVPSVFLGPASSAPETAFATLGALQSLGAAPHGSAQALQNLISLLPKGGSIYQLGLMLSRQEAPLRVCIEGIAASDLPEFLGKVGRADCINAIIDELASSDLELGIGLDLCPEIGLRIGIECYAGHDQHAPERTEALHELLRRHSLATDAAIEALQLWPGLLHQRLLSEAWPSWLACPEGADAGGIQRYVNHVKISLCAGTSSIAKAYLAARIAWFNSDALKFQLRSVR